MVAAQGAVSGLARDQGQRDDARGLPNMGNTCAINAATQMGLRVPERLKVLGFDNLSFTAFWPIPISTFALPYESMGSLSGTTLFSMINNEDFEPSTVFLESPLVPRRSTGY